MLVFFDNILIYKQNKPDHIQHLKVVFQVLKDKKLYAKRSGYVFGSVEISYLGHIISARGVNTNQSKIKVV